MAAAKFTAIVLFVGLIWSQQTFVRAQLIAGAAGYATSTVTTTMTTTTTVLSGANMAIDYYDVSGNGLYSSWYPFYSPNYNIPMDLMNDLTVNEYIGYLTNTYSIPMTNMYQMYSLLHSSMPTITTDLEFHMLEDLATYYQQAKLNLMATPYDYSLKAQNYYSFADYRNYLPPNYPESLLSSLAYIDYRIPYLNDGIKSSIETSIYNYSPATMRTNANYLAFQMQTSMRYMIFNEMSYSYSYSWY